ncbi:MAG: CopG family transcriptional regulator [archaeon]
MVKIKKEILEKLEKRAKELGKGVDEYINDILKQVVEKIEKEKGNEDSAFSEEDEEKVKDRLRNLGYLD